VTGPLLRGAANAGGSAEGFADPGVQVLGIIEAGIRRGAC
jgi:hypothetical protein